ncbi:MAG: hypothetical protein H7836_10170 [Magnetococcus sp. YQC-3]
MKRYADVLLTLSGLLLLLTFAAKPPAEAGAWPTTLPHALGGAILALLGLFLWRRQPQPLWGENPSMAAEEEDIPGDATPLTACVEELQALQSGISLRPMEEIFLDLESVYNRHIFPLSLARKRLTIGLDRARGLELLALFSRGELWINRARSAAGDRHREETRLSLIQALEIFLAVQRLRHSGVEEGCA